MPQTIDPLDVREPTAFLERTGRLPNNPVVGTILEAIFNAGPSAKQLMGGWYETENGLPAYSRLGRQRGRITIRVGPSSLEPDGEEPDRNEQWSIVEGMSALTVDTLLTVLAQLCDPRLGDKTVYPRCTPLGISTASILRYKGYRRWGSEREAFSARIATEIERLSRFQVDVSDFPAWDPGLRRWNPNGVSVTGDRLIHTLETPFRDADHSDWPGGTEKRRVWAMRLGSWSQWWLNTQGKFWTIDLPLGVIELDHRPNRASQVLAKKIGLNATLLLGMVKTRPIIIRRIDRLLEDIGELPRFECRHNHWAGRIRDRFEEAMFILEEAGLVGGVEWLDNARPGSGDRQKGWVDRWLAAKIKIIRAGQAAMDDDDALSSEAAPYAVAKSVTLGEPGLHLLQQSNGRTRAPFSLVEFRSRTAEPHG